MKTFTIALLALAPFAQALPATTPALEVGQAQYDSYRTQSTANMKAILAKRTSGCTLKNVLIRKEWTALSVHDRVKYTDAVRCLQSKPPITPKSVIPGARSRFDDFQAVHINQSSFVHWTTYFNPWHRYLVHVYETALRDECGYTGAHPYWDWSANGANLTKQEIFSGAVGSLGGDGTYIPLRNTTNGVIPAVPPIITTIYPGSGGGCIKNGPFVNLNTSLGPYGPPISQTWTQSTPRCVTRDFRPEVLMASSTYEKIAALLAKPTIETFIATLDPIHGAGHTSIGGLQSDIFASNGDPAFYLHHGQMDHIWAVWQGLDFQARRDLVTGTLTLMDRPPSANGTLDTTMDLGYNAGPLTSRDLASTIDGKLCYIYE